MVNGGSASKPRVGESTWSNAKVALVTAFIGNAMSNTPDGIRVDIVREMKIFDALPVWLRDILNYAPENYDAEGAARVYVDWKKRGLSEEYMHYEFKKRLMH